MNVLKPNLKITIETLLEKGLSQREISRKTGIHRRTIRRYCQQYKGVVFEGAEDSKCPTPATGSGGGAEACPFCL
jgi:DNA invertase Pin-like site-specific DNA recombinase